MLDKIATIAVVLLIAVGSFTVGSREGCANDLQFTESNFAAVECCCQTANGGTCCAIVQWCGPFIPGCLCQ